MTHIERANALVREGHLSQLTETQLKVFQVFHVHADGETGVAYPGTTKVATLIGHKDHKRARQAIDALVEKGYLLLVCAATFKTPAKYLVTLPALQAGEQPPADTSAEEGVKLPPPEQIAEQVRQTAPGEIDPTPGGPTDPSPGGPVGPPNSESNSETNSGARASAAGAGRRRQPTGATESAGFVRWWATIPDNGRRTDRAGALAIWRADDLEPRADAIIRHTAACAGSGDWTKDGGRWMPSPRRYLAERRYEGKPLGVIATPAAAPRGVSTQELQTMREEASARFDRELALNALSRTELDELARDVRAALPPNVAEAIAKDDPRRSETLRWKMFELLERQRSATSAA